MARIRTIKPEFFTSEDILDLSIHARLLYVGLWCEADREGRLAWKPKTLKVRYLPSDNVDIESLCQELTSKGLIRLYGEGLAYIPSFLKHQHVNPREAKSIYPDPLLCEVGDASARVGHASNLDLHASARVTDASNLDLHAQVGRERKGKEREGKEGEGTRVATREEIPPPSHSENQDQEPPDELKAKQAARRLSELYQKTVAPSSLPKSGISAILCLLTEHMISPDVVETSIHNYAKYRVKLGKDPPHPMHAPRFFSEGHWETFRNSVPELATLPISEGAKDERYNELRQRQIAEWEARNPGKKFPGNT